MRGAFLQIAIAILFSARPAFAIASSRAVTQSVRRVWTFEQGLPRERVQVIVQTPDGDLCMGTQEGVLRFDGASSSIFDARSALEISPDNEASGAYDFGVAATPADGRWIPAPVPIRDRTPWLAALCVAVAMSLIVLLHLLRLRSIRLRHEAVLAERNRIARDFHDTMAQGLTGLSMHLEGAIGSLGEPARATEYLQTAKRLVRNSQAEARRALMDLRPEGLEGHDLPDALRKMLALMTEQLPVRGTVLVHGKPRRVAGERVESHLLRIAQEAVTNALRHARARNIEILLRYESGRIRLAIRDDGHGLGPFPPDPFAVTSHGLRGMRERAGEIGARFVIRNHGARGLEVAVEVVA